MALMAYYPDQESSQYNQGAAEAETQLLSSMPVKIKDSEFYASTDETERDLIRFELNCALHHFLELDRPIFLDSLGLFIPILQQRVNGYPSGQALVIRKEVIRSVQFEKTDDFLESFNRSAVSKITSKDPEVAQKNQNKVVELQELTHRIYPKLPIAMHLKWCEQGFRSLLRAYLLTIREKLVNQGFSANLSALGTLYALHNRYGSTERDWFAGADIQLYPRKPQVVEVLSSNLHARPVLNSAWEMLAASYGNPVETYQLDIDQELAGLGVESPSPGSRIHVAIFYAPAELGMKPRFIFCTEGLRYLAYQVREHSIGTELMLQIPVEESLNLEEQLETRIKRFGDRLLALGWAMLYGTRGKTLRVGLGINLESPIVDFERTSLTGVIATSASPLSGSHLCSDGEFAYANLLGISNAESKLISSGKRLHLLAMLELKGLGQITNLKRKCILSSTKI